MRGVISRIFKVVTVVAYLIIPALCACTIISENYSKSIKSAVVWCEYNNKDYRIIPNTHMSKITQWDVCDICQQSRMEDHNLNTCTDYSDLDESYVKQITYQPIGMSLVLVSLAAFLGGCLVLDILYGILFYIKDGKFTLKHGCYSKIFKLFSRKIK